MTGASPQTDPVPGSMRTGATAYFVFAILWSAVFWLASTRISASTDPSTSIVFLIGGAGPLIGALVLTHLREPAIVQRDFWVRTFDPRRIRGRWWAAALLMHPAIVGLALAVDLAMGGALPSTEKWPASVGALFGMAFFVFWFGPLPEEMGWRGFALDRLQRRMNPLLASLVLGSVWSLWHVPLFFIPGTFQHELGAGSARFWTFMASNVPLSVLMTWVYNNTSRSTLSAALIHYSGNLCGAFIPKTDRLAALELFGLLAAAVIVARSMSKRSGKQ